MAELLAAIQSSRNTSPGPDDIYYQMIRYLQSAAITFVLYIYNRIWTEDRRRNNLHFENLKGSSPIHKLQANLLPAVYVKSLSEWLTADLYGYWNAMAASLIPNVDSPGPFRALYTTYYPRPSTRHSSLLWRHSLYTDERRLQFAINRVSRWVLRNVFSFSTGKTQCLNFTRLRSLQLYPSLYLNNTALPFAYSVRFIGLFFVTNCPVSPT
jgi:hypothetical protein